MFTIDLLKAEGLPAKSRPQGMVITAVTLAVPVVAAILMFGSYAHNRAVISIEHRKLENYSAKIQDLSEAVELQQNYEKSKQTINNCLSEVATSLDRHTQWSPILVTVVKNMPKSMALNELSIRQHTVGKKVPRRDDPEKVIQISVPVRTLQIGLFGYSDSDSDRCVREFRDRLRNDNTLRSRLENIAVSQEFGTYQDREAVFYRVDCIFKPNL